MPYRLSQIADILAKYQMPCEIIGDAGREVIGVATLEDAGPQEISFLSNAKYEKALQTTRAGAVIVSQDQAIPNALTVLRTTDPYAAVTAVMVHVHGYRQHPPCGIDPRSVIASSAKIGPGACIHHNVTIGENVTIGKNAVFYPGCYIARDCQIGDDCLLYPNVVIYDGSLLGHRVTIHAGSVIGEDGLGYAPVKEKWHKIPQIGIVEIGDDVEIGANCSIDRATLGRTLIAEGTKFSNLIAIGHGTKIGRDCMLVAHVGIAGSVVVGNHVTMAGKAGVAGHLTIGDNAQLGAMCGVMKDVPADTSVAGTPAIPLKDALRSFAYTARLPEMAKQIKELEAQVEALQKALDVRAAR
ncbi:MAG TPA: UDP-3-O-(3-hydroxymyristoyl)glucosamine N-acyltransferase [Phycisphaerae bacterium]|nr:UDP-3-O-(3-hydroxymyristoyl)glucosamine N-acyltransferase [Phycisphaerae bacterium]